MYIGDLEGTVDCCNPNDWGLVSLARAFGGAVSKALGSKPLERALQTRSKSAIITAD